MRAPIIGFAIALGVTGAHAGAFAGFDCRDNCEGHAAGYDWAEQHNIRDWRDCPITSQSFEEGCRTKVLEPFRGSDLDDDGNLIPRRP
jgi:hypothetical protein